MLVKLFILVSIGHARGVDSFRTTLHVNVIKHMQINVNSEPNLHKNRSMIVSECYRHGK